MLIRLCNRLHEKGRLGKGVLLFHVENVLQLSTCEKMVADTKNSHLCAVFQELPCRGLSCPRLPLEAQEMIKFGRYSQASIPNFLRASLSFFRVGIWYI